MNVFLTTTLALIGRASPCGGAQYPRAHGVAAGVWEEEVAAADEGTRVAGVDAGVCKPSQLFAPLFVICDVWFQM